MKTMCDDCGLITDCDILVTITVMKHFDIVASLNVTNFYISHNKKKHPQHLFFDFKLTYNRSHFNFLKKKLFKRNHLYVYCDHPSVDSGNAFSCHYTVTMTSIKNLI